MEQRILEEYLETGTRNREIQQEHWAEALECFRMTKKYNYLQLAEKLTNNAPATIWRYINKETLVQPEVRKKHMKRMKILLKEENKINIWNKRRVTL